MNQAPYSEYFYATPERMASASYLLPAILSVLKGLPAGTRILDIGCGNGALTSAWANTTWDVHAVDNSASGISIATRAYPNINFTQANAGPDLMERFAPQSFDLIISTEVIEHLYAPRLMVAAAHALLKPGGRLVLTCPYHGYLKNLALAATGAMDNHFTALMDCGHIKFWSRKTLCALLTEAGFDEPTFTGVGRLPYLWKSMMLNASKPLTASA